MSLADNSSIGLECAVQYHSTAAAKCASSDCKSSQIEDICKGVDRVFE